jgi:hypothetical protein
MLLSKCLYLCAGGERSSEPPAVAFRIYCTILALAIRPVYWFILDLRASSSGLLVMGLQVIHMDDETGTGEIPSSRRGHVMPICHAVEPDRIPACTNLGMNGIPCRITMNASTGKAESLNQEIMRGGNIFVNKHGN